MNGTFKPDALDVRPPSAYRLTEPLRPDPAAVARSADLLAAARFPVIHAGNGVLAARAWDDLVLVAELLQALVAVARLLRKWIENLDDKQVTLYDICRRNLDI